MGRRGKYKKILSKEEKEKRSVIIAIVFIICLFFYLFIVRKGITLLQWSLFSNIHTLLLVPSLGIWAFLEIMGGPTLIIASVFYLKYKIDRNKERYLYYTTVKTKTLYSKFLMMTVIISFILVLVSFFSYCRIDKDGLYVREIRTAFIEKEFSWDAVRSVEINYYKNSKGSGYNLQYIINMDKFSINIQNAGLTSNHEMLDQSKKEIHESIKERSIPVYKHIDKYDDEINEFLNLIGE